jgi:autotransporter adhesin
VGIKVGAEVGVAVGAVVGLTVVGAGVGASDAVQEESLSKLVKKPSMHAHE